MNISNNISSIQAHQSMLNNSAHNVANVNTDGFVPTNTRISGGDNYVKAENSKADNNGSKMSQTDLANEMTTQIIAVDATSVNVTALRTQDEMLGSLLDIKA
jgi:flagellar hook protein FlgE